MTLDPVLPLWLLAAGGAALLGLCAWAAVRERGRRAQWAARLALVALVLAAAVRPGVPQQAAGTRTEADADVFFVVDTTASMVAEDWDGAHPRLDGVRRDAADLAARLPGARFSLIAFDSSAQARMPLTTDTAALRSALEVLGPELTFRSAGSSVAEAAEVLGERLERAREQRPDSSRYVYYLGDGEQTARGEPRTMAQAVGLVTGGAVLGYGTREGGRMRRTAGYGAAVPGSSAGAGQPSADAAPPYIEDPQTGTAALSRIDEDRLRAIAAQLHVPYAHRSAGQSLNTAVDTPAVHPIAVSGPSAVDTRREFFWLFLLPAFALLVAEAGVVGVRLRAVGRTSAGRAPRPAQRAGTPTGTAQPRRRT